jgi:hypothetical protein
MRWDFEASVRTISASKLAGHALDLVAGLRDQLFAMGQDKGALRQVTACELGEDDGLARASRQRDEKGIKALLEFRFDGLDCFKLRRAEREHNRPRPLAEL